MISFSLNPPLEPLDLLNSTESADPFPILILDAKTPEIVGLSSVLNLK